uniref:Response regulator receiver domain-containing protein n=1 Tax=Candidatus Kentrum sp. MB TaxID=2138164 RepID=A0A450XJ95_9GAMM|nr:MAG: Response regulator receiver domain-containing protein [Candidatus Kentron sp. MB]VFK29357.1 MAG: Response regulator receiver domain-containing protein [Candidatus Kentron sp. MB]VFK74761.1 MAG: Response regulator receiver domain-containing protein [Candidatus Kentron sp. MB]
MKYLIIDDIPVHIKLLAVALRRAEHQVETARNLDIGWDKFKHERNIGTPFDLVVLDLTLDRKTQACAEEQEIIRESLILRDLGDLPMSGQAMGLWLWRQRKGLQQRYCYMSYHRYLWIPRLDGEDPEFDESDHESRGRKIPERLLGLILEKSNLWPDNIAAVFQNAWQIWEDRKWLR